VIGISTILKPSACECHSEILVPDLRKNSALFPSLRLLSAS
jgi:hypothetical protein